MTEPLDASTWNASRTARRRRGCLLLVLLPLGVISLVVAWAGLRMFDKPNIARNFTAEFNARFEGIPEDQKAWPLYKQAILARLEVQPSDDLLTHWPTFPGGPMWAESTAHVERLQPALDKARLAAGKPFLARELGDTTDPDIARAEAEAFGREYVPEPPGQPNPMMLAILLPDLSYMRRFAQDLSVENFLAAEAGRGDRVVENFEAMLGMANHCAENRTLIGQLVQFAIEALAERQLAQVLAHYPDLLSGEQLARLQQAFTTIGRTGPAPAEGITRYDLTMEMERAFFYDIIQRSFSDDGHGDGHMTLEGARLFSMISSVSGSTSEEVGKDAEALGSVLLSASRRQTVEKYDDFMDRFEAAADKRPWQRQPGEITLDAEVEELHASTLGNLRYPFITMLMPALTKAALTKDLADTRRDAAIATIAIARYHADHQRYPAALSDLLPDYLPALPIDPVDGKPLRYLLTPNGPILYSLGYDEDDDQGRSPPDPAFAQPLTNYHGSGSNEGDWVLYPAAMPKPEPEE